MSLPPPKPEESSNQVPASQDKRAQKAKLKELKKQSADIGKRDFERKYGQVVASGLLGKYVRIYSKGFVSIGLFGAGKRTPEKLKQISGNADVTKKTGLGRGIGFVATMGYNVILSPNKRGDIYLVIVTDKRTYQLHRSPPTKQDMKTFHLLLTAGQSVLKSVNDAQETGMLNVVSTTTPGRTLNLSEEIEKLGKLHSNGTLSDEEFEMAKKRVLGG